MAVNLPPSTVEQLVLDSTTKAESLIKDYYTALDLPIDQRTARVISLYSSEARISWNGNPIPGPSLPDFLERMPKSEHKVQAFDCHPVVGSATNAPPALVVTATGQVTHNGQAHPPPGTVPSRNFDALPRVFSQTFILAFGAPSSNGAPEARYSIVADSYRFV